MVLPMKLFGSKKYSIWRDPLFAALIGVLTAFLLIANVSDVAENGFMHLRVWLARHFFVPGGGTKFYLLSLTDGTEPSYQAHLASVINKFAGSGPRTVAIFLDLRGVPLEKNLQEALLLHRQHLVVTIFGIDEKSHNAYLDLLNAGITCGYLDEKADTIDALSTIQLASKPAANSPDGSLMVPPFAAAVIQSTENGREPPWQKTRERFQGADRFVINYCFDPLCEPITEAEAGGDTTASGLSGGILVLSQTQNAQQQWTTPVGTKENRLQLALRAIDTLASTRLIADYSQWLRLLMLPLAGLLGATFLLLKPLQRANMILSALLLVFVAEQVLFQCFDILLPTMPPVLTILSCYLACSLIFIEAEEAKRHRDLMALIQSSAERERRRIAKDIHDETLPEMARLKRLADSSASLSGNEVREDICKRLDTAIIDLRRVVDDLHPIILDNFGLNSALKSLIDRVSRHTKITTDYTCSAENLDEDLDELKRLTIYRIVQEALNNIEKHAQATSAVIRLERRNGNILVQVIDNGKGLGVPVSSQKETAGTGSGAGSVTPSHGMQIIRQRAELIGAQVTWNKPDCFESGTELRLLVDT